MAKLIWKFTLKMNDVQMVEMPEGAKVLTVQVQNSSPCVWVLVDSDLPTTKVWFEIFGTGYPMPENDRREYVGTFQLGGGALVYHCFKLLNHTS